MGWYILEHRALRNAELGQDPAGSASCNAADEARTDKKIADTLSGRAEPVREGVTESGDNARDRHEDKTRPKQNEVGERQKLRVGWKTGRGEGGLRHGDGNGGRS